MVQVSHGDRFCSHQLSQQTNARSKSETYSPSISIKRPFSKIPKLVIQMSAAVVDPRPPKLARAIVTNAIATARTQMVEPIRPAHSLRAPKILKDAATSQFTSGGLLK